jgi:hypothetical protein
VYTFIPAIFNITPPAFDITTSGSDEISGFTRVSAFSLYGVEMFHDGIGDFIQ